MPRGWVNCVRRAFQQGMLPPVCVDAQRSAVNGMSAMLRARLMAVPSWRWCRAQLPEMRRGMIFPRSVIKFRKRLMSL
jgi:hypothetical protein